MGSVVGTAANGVGTFLGNAFAAPFRTLLGASCEGVCSGTWDVACFIEHLCFSSLARLFMVIVLTYITLFFVYLLCKVGIIKCVAKNACKMAWKACSGSCRALGGACCLLWGKLRDTKRVRRGRRRQRDIEEGERSSSWADTDSSSSDGDHRGSVASAGGSRAGGKWPSVRERRKDRLRQSLRLRGLSFKEERATRRSRGSERMHRHAIGPRRVEVSSLRVHGSATHRRARAHRAHERSAGTVEYG
ncbi:uncharacterized protein LOC133892588 isoform X2 [Phragmites australis]|uniref:uncharacterized protein LOC133892588 isoform X2 n=1 Tax=Phragmites australis TaxID=29695 RepID=UPI002D79247A|nr:uncharacterized protein LOC133892588 isoform X2 [Phragmites australis]